MIDLSTIDDLRRSLWASAAFFVCSVARFTTVMGPGLMARMNAGMALDALKTASLSDEVLKNQRGRLN